jgi:hypothetical protein
MREATGCNALAYLAQNLLAGCHLMPTATTSLLLLVAWEPAQQELAVIAATGMQTHDPGNAMSSAWPLHS